MTQPNKSDNPSTPSPNCLEWLYGLKQQTVVEERVRQRKKGKGKERDR